MIAALEFTGPQPGKFSYHKTVTKNPLTRPRDSLIFGDLYERRVYELNGIVKWIVVTVIFLFILFTMDRK